tara:strand:- start:1427 stop:1681 length:255 start_codon:yes stop_codon:yes gene_type:complete
MSTKRFDTEDAARALVDILWTGHIRTDRHGWYTDDLWDLGLLWNVAAHEADTKTTYDYLDRPHSGWKVTDRGWRYINFYGLGGN